jgi:hypothetical protein
MTPFFLPDNEHFAQNTQVRQAHWVKDGSAHLAFEPLLIKEEPKLHYVATRSYFPTSNTCQQDRL